jgi:hypothetical protein
MHSEKITYFLFFLFALLAAYMECCFGPIFNLIIEEISRHLFASFFYSFTILNLKKNPMKL